MKLQTKRKLIYAEKDHGHVADSFIISRAFRNKDKLFEDSYEEGSNIMLTIIPENQYRGFVMSIKEESSGASVPYEVLSDNHVDIGRSYKIEFTMPNDNVVLDVHFSKVVH